MSELIDRYATIDAIPAPTDADEAEYYGKICDAIEAIPTIDAEPVRHGRWIPVDGGPYAKCSYCGEKHYGCSTPYCDMCGTYMRKEGANNG